MTCSHDLWDFWEWGPWSQQALFTLGEMRGPLGWRGLLLTSSARSEPGTPSPLPYSPAPPPACPLSISPSHPLQHVPLPPTPYRIIPATFADFFDPLYLSFSVISSTESKSLDQRFIDSLSPFGDAPLFFFSLSLPAPNPIPSLPHIFSHSHKIEDSPYSETDKRGVLGGN